MDQAVSIVLRFPLHLCGFTRSHPGTSPLVQIWRATATGHVVTITTRDPTEAWSHPCTVEGTKRTKLRSSTKRMKLQQLNRISDTSASPKL